MAFKVFGTFWRKIGFLILKSSGKCKIAVQVFRNFGPTAAFQNNLNLKPEEGMLIKIQEDRQIEEIFEDLWRGS